MTDSARRYQRLREDRPDLFAADGPVRLDPREPGDGEGVPYDSPWFMVVADPVILPDGRPGSYRRIVHAASGTPVAVLPVTADGRIVLIDHWRHATRRSHLEIPRGFGEDGVAAVDQAAAELREELCLEGRLEPLGTLHPDTGLMSAEVALFAAHVPGDAVPTHSEGHGAVVILTDAEFRRAVLDGTVTDPFAIAAWTRLRLLSRDPL